MTAVVTKTEYEEQVIARGLRSLWALDFMPDERLLVTAKPGAIRIITPDGKVGEPLAGLPEIVAGGDAGLLDIACDPAFAKNRQVFFTFVEPRTRGTGLSVGRARISDDEKSLQDVAVIYRVEPAYGMPAHFGSRLLFDREGKLLVSTGERFMPPARDQAQSLAHAFGKILRINPDGTPSERSPFDGTEGALKEVLSYGHRNPQGLASIRRRATSGTPSSVPRVATKSTLLSLAKTTVGR